jgi:hypothetical protein
MSENTRFSWWRNRAADSPESRDFGAMIRRGIEQMRDDMGKPVDRTPVYYVTSGQLRDMDRLVADGVCADRENAYWWTLGLRFPYSPRFAVEAAPETPPDWMAFHDELRWCRVVDRWNAKHL